MNAKICTKLRIKKRRWISFVFSLLFVILKVIILRSHKLIVALHLLLDLFLINLLRLLALNPILAPLIEHCE